MASFAPGTSQQQMDDYYRRVGPSLGGTGREVPLPPRTMPTSRNSVTVSGGRVTPYSPQPSQSQSKPPRPGQAQPQQTQPQGAPYNPQQGGNFSAYSPQQPAPQQNLSGYRPQQGFSGYNPQQPAMPQARYAEGTSQEYRIQNPDTGPFPPQGSGGNYSAFDPNMANNAQAPRPPAFQAAYGQMGGGYSDQPGTPQRDAFISQVNNQLGQMQGQSWQQPTGAPQFNFGQMMGQANQMVDQGFQNPFAMQPPTPSPPPQDNAAAIRGLLQGFNIPPNVMEQISGMFGGQQAGGRAPINGQPDATASILKAPDDGVNEPVYGSDTPRQMQKPGPGVGGRAQPVQDPYESSRQGRPQTQDQIQAEYAQLSPLIQSLASARGVGSSGRTGGLSGPEAYRAHQDWRQTRMRVGQDPGPEQTYEQVMQELERARGLETRATELQEEQRQLRKSQAADRAKAGIAATNRLIWR